ncbi:hypothetical protein A8C32_09930 [Flavivirga aquatica]|uniref:LysM domain-containing protein n=1 Tax=Flavivirga aquatica TaxID=1849968 RepID=A0A1E5TEM1_9FLAO|nr:LysM domain-containing protein [Flavivirga aquatica]OEK09820.1 hypothetical protein A8C32_09930 [Flavivirga aquatica]
MPIVYLTEDPSVRASCPPLKPRQQEVSKAYFAKREEKAQYKTIIKDHVTAKGETLSKIANKYKVSVKDVKRTKNTKYLQVGETVKVTIKEKKGVEVKFVKLNKATIGEDVYIIVETKHLEEETVLINILQGQEDVLAKKDAPLTVQQDSQEVTKIQEKVGNYCKEEEVSNKDDFKDWAIVKVKLQPKTAADQKAWNNGLECAGTKKAMLFLLVDVHSENSISNFKSEYILYKGYKKEKDDSTIPNHFLNEEGTWFEVTNSKTIHIYHDGTISKVDLKNAEKVSYVYNAENDKEYNICTCDLLEIDERLKGVSDDKKIEHEVKVGFDKNKTVVYDHDSSRKKYTYSDGTIRTYGKFYNPDKKTNYRLVTYKKGSNKKFIVKMPSSLNKNIGDNSISFSFTRTARRYCGPEHLACFIGALAEVGYSIKSGGACEEDGTSYPSISHINGQSVDTSYLDDIMEQKFINAMHKFGFLSQLRGSGKKVFSHTSDGGKLHNNHLHSGGLSPNYK